MEVILSHINQQKLQLQFTETDIDTDGNQFTYKQQFTHNHESEKDRIYSIQKFPKRKVCTTSNIIEK